MARKWKIHKKKKRSIHKHAEAKMNRLETKFSRILTDLGVKWKSQHVVKDRIYDFYLPDFGILIECDGDYFHCNPRKYPKGPINRMQKRNIKNDLYKNSLAKVWGFELIRIWEYDIVHMGAVVSRNMKLLLETKKGKTI